MGELRSLSKIVKIVAKTKKEGKRVSLITGCFDIIHVGHIRLFHFARTHSDVVIVGLENDHNVRLFKGEGRPIYKFKERSEVLTELKSIDWVFEIKDVINFDSPHANNLYLSLYKQIRPDFLVTNSVSDKFWKKKLKNAKDLNIKLLLNKRKKDSSSTGIIEKLEKEL